MIITWFRKIFDAILGGFGGGSQSPSTEQTSSVGQTVVNPKVTVNIEQSQMKEYFLDLSAALTGFSKFDLHGTGQVEAYFSTVEENIGQEIFQELLQTFHTNQSVSEILESAKFGAIARNITKLWFVATWYSLSDDEDFIVSPQAYPEGLLWRAIGANPPAAKAPGYATWAEEPSVSLN